MKKYIATILLILICYFGYSQYPIQQNLGSGTTLVKNPNYGGFQGGLIPYTFTDTTAASAALTYGSTYNGFIIYTSGDSALYFRCCGANKWQQILPSGGSSGQRAWLISGNAGIFTSPVDPQYVGTKTAQGFGFKTSDVARLTIPSTGIARTSDAAYKYLMFDTSGSVHLMAYGDGGSGSSGWALTGNAGTTAGTNFLGTTDNVDLVLKSNAIERMRWNTSGALGLGAGTSYGTSGYLLKTNGSGAAPAWVNYDWQAALTAGSTLTGDNDIDGGKKILQFTDMNAFVIYDSLANVKLSISSNGLTELNGGISSLSTISINDTLTFAMNSKSLITIGEIIQINPYQGDLRIDTLTNAVGTKALRYNPTTGLVSYADTTTGGGAVAWNAITSPTADQALTFDAGESSTWTDANTTEDLFTVNSSTGTTNSMFSLNRTGTALASGNNILELVSSGANGTNAITVTGLSVSVANTNATSGTNIGAAFSASGATTANYSAQFTGAIVPGANDGSAIGTTTRQFSDLFLAEGGVINWDNGDATLTQVGNSVTLDGAAFLVTSPSQTPASFSSSFAGNMQVNWNSTTSNNVNFVFQEAGTPTWYIGNNASVDRLHILNSAAAEVVTVLQGQQVGINKTAPTARLHIGAGLATASYAPLKFTTGTNNTTAEAGAMEYTTPQLFFTNGRAVRQEIFQGQQSRVSTQYDNTTTTLGNVTGLTANVAASGTYRFEAKLYTTSDVAGGIKVAIGGTATATAIRYEGLTTDAGLTTQGRATALGTAVGAVTAVTAAYVVITGTITVNAAGTITVQAAANAATGTTSVLTGSTFVITEML